MLFHWIISTFEDIVRPSKNEMNSTSKRSAAQVTSALLKIRAWEKLHIPSSQSTLSNEIFWLIAHHNMIQQPLNLKQLFLSISYSETAIRLQLNNLIEQRYCSLVIDTNDKRLKHVVAGEKMIALIDQYAILVADSLAVKALKHKKISITTHSLSR